MRTADVYAYDKSIKPIENIPIVKGATAYDDLDTGKTYISYECLGFHFLEVNQHMYFMTMKVL
eukprot:scaffold2965_cov35-Attheya_sp.AAC.1